jgi:hypothetical protein
MIRSIRLAVVALIACLLAAVSGCEGSPPAATVSSPTLTVATEAGPASSSPTALPVIIPTAETPDPVAAASGALAGRLGIEQSSVVYVDAIQVDWDDTSLGCPQPDEDYLQVKTPGFLVRLAVGSDIYEVHTDLVGTAVVCGDAGSGEATIRDPIVAEFAAEARANLATRLGVAAEQIALVRSEAVEWSGSNLGCADDSGDVVAAATTGYRIVLALGEDRYEYHTDQQRMILCEVPTE